MERKFYTDNFEKLLKENADQFKMYPSKKVWHGLYNDLHPGRRWPSITMSIIFLFSLVIIGHLNTSNNHRQQIASTGQSSIVIVDANHKKAGHKNSTLINDDADHPEDQSIVETPGQTAMTEPDPNMPSGADNSIPHDLNQPSIIEPASGTQKETKVIPPPAHSDAQTFNPRNANNDLSGVVTHTDGNSVIAQVKHNIVSSSIKTGIANSGNLTSANEESPTSSDSLSDFKTASVLVPKTYGSQEDQNDQYDQQLTSSVTKPNQVKDKDQKLQVSKESKTVVSDKKQEVKKTNEIVQSANILQKIRKKNTSYTFYLVPTISYRNIVNPKTTNNIAAANSPIIVSSPINDSRQFPSLGFETGVSANYKLFKKVQFVTGLQFNYTRYSIEATSTHPTMASLVLNRESDGSPYSLSTLSIYGNNTGTGQSNEITLHNYSFQASVPVGLQYEVWSNSNIKLNAIATFQPSFTLANQSYILSTDKRNYLTDKDLLRTWNLNTNFGTYVSFKTNSFNWQIGPQIRYQILSTFSSNYPSKEHRIDYGMRLGVTKIIK